METETPEVIVNESPEAPEAEVTVINETAPAPAEPTPDLMGMLTNIQLQIEGGKREEWQGKTTETLAKIAGTLETLTGQIAQMLNPPSESQEGPREAETEPTPGEGTLTVETPPVPNPSKKSRTRRLSFR